MGKIIKSLFKTMIYISSVKKYYLRLVLDLKNIYRYIDTHPTILVPCSSGLTKTVRTMFHTCKVN